jgi:cation:H+ antiporter
MIPSGFEILAVPIFILGVLILYKGSDTLVDGTSKTAAKLGVSTLIISVLLVGFGTSAPELAISVGAAIQNDSGISLGNVIGSCIANLLLILGLSALIRPIKINKGIIGREMPILLGATFVLLFSSYANLFDNMHFFGGLIFIILFIMFVIYFVQCAKREKIKNNKIKSGNTGKNIFFIIIGIVSVIIGAELLIISSVTIAEILNIPTFIIAISIVAIGTSLPELAVSVMAAYKGESDIAIGNVLGSNVFNIFLILGIAALFIPLNAIDSIGHIIILVAVTLLMYPILYTGHKISRIEGFLMLVFYGLFIWYAFFGYTYFI